MSQHVCWDHVPTTPALQQQYVDPAPNSFVTRGTDGSLLLNGRRYFGFGATNYGLAAQPEFYAGPGIVRNIMQGYKAEGVNVLRIWYVC